MSATTSTATTGQSNQVGPRAAAAVLVGVVALGAIGLAISQRTSTSAAVDRPAAGAVVDNVSMSGPRTAAQKGLVAKGAAANNGALGTAGAAFSTPQGSGTYTGASTNRPPENAITKPVAGPVQPSFDGRRLSSQFKRPE